MHPEIPVFIALLVALNLHVLPGLHVEPQVFFHDLVLDGEWWRIFSHAFVHRSWYHILLDGVAFLIIYSSLDAPPAKRLLYFAGSLLGSLGLAVLLDPRIYDLGLAGLSGSAHGLMAVAGLELVSQREPLLRRLGWISVALVSGKGLIELITGEVLLEFLQLGLTGTPIAVCHLGGVLGGVATFALVGLHGGVRRGRGESPRGSRPYHFSSVARSFR